jgi:hypothetical protein
MRRWLFLFAITVIFAGPEQEDLSRTPFSLSWSVGRCVACRFATRLETIQFTNGRNGWAIGDAWPPAGAEGLGERVVVHTLDGGRTWKELPFTHMHAASPVVWFLNNANGWICWGTPLGEFKLARTLDEGKTWLDVPGTFEWSSLFLDDTNWYGVDGGIFLRTRDAGRTWSRTELPLVRGVDRVFFLSPEIGWIAGSVDDHSIVLRTVDGGRDWEDGGGAIPGRMGKVQDLFFLSPTHGWLIASRSPEIGSDLFATMDGGRTWTRVQDSLLQGSHMSASMVRFISESTGFVFRTEERAECPGCSPRKLADSRNDMVSTSDGGVHWHRQTIPHTINDCQVFEGDLRCSAGSGHPGFLLLRVHPN